MYIRENTRTNGTSCRKSTRSQHQIQQILPRGTFSNFSDEVVPHREHENCCRFATLQCTLNSLFARRETLGSTLQLEFCQNYGTSCWKKSQVDVLPDVDLIADPAKKKKMWAMQHRCLVLRHTSHSTAWCCCCAAGGRF